MFTPYGEPVTALVRVNETARTVAVHEGEAISAAALGAMFKQIIANNRAGGWRKPNRGA